MITASAVALIVCAAFFLHRGYLVRYRHRHDLITSLEARRLSDAAAWCRLVGLLNQLLGAAFLLLGLLALVLPAQSREMAILFCAILLLAWGPTLTVLQRYEAS